MRIFVTGASGWIGSAVVPELVEAGHTVLGLARSEQSAAAIAAMGADVQRGSIDDLETVRSGASSADAVVHLAYNHDFSDMPGAARTDRAVIDVVGDALAGSDRPFLIASGLAGLKPGSVSTE